MGDLFMEQIKKMLVYPDNKEVLPHIIHYLSYIGITVNPSGEPDISQQCAHYRASFNYKDVELIPTITSQNSWWLQPSTDAVDDRTVVVGTNEVSFVIGSNEKASESSKHFINLPIQHLYYYRITYHCFKHIFI